MDYYTSLEKEIVTEGLMNDIGKKAMSIFKFIGDLIKKAISFLTGLIGKLKKSNVKDDDFKGPKIVDKNGKEVPYDEKMEQIIQDSIKKRSNMNPTPNSMKGAGSEVMTNEIITSSVAPGYYDCGNELERVVNDVQFCLEMLIKRPTPDHKVGKGYAERWAGDNELIADRMAKAAEVLEKLEGIEKKSLSVPKAEILKDRLEVLNKQYEKYARIYDLFVKKNQHTEVFFATTIASFDQISNVAGKTLNIIMQLHGFQG